MTGSAQDEVLQLAHQLIRIDSTNTGDSGSSITERAAAEWVAEKLTDIGLDPIYVESGAPGRGNVIVRIAGADPTRGALLVHCHLDVVPADASEWSVHPLSGEVKDGYLWGRGAVDMKDMVAMSLAVLRQLVREKITPPRDLVFAFLAPLCALHGGGDHLSRRCHLQSLPRSPVGSSARSGWCATDLSFSRV